MAKISLSEPSESDQWWRSVMHYTFQLVEFLVHSSISGMLVWSPPPPLKIKIWADLGTLSLTWSGSTPHPPTPHPHPRVSGSSYAETNFCILRGYHLVVFWGDLCVSWYWPAQCSSCSFTKILQLLQLYQDPAALLLWSARGYFYVTLRLFSECRSKNTQWIWHMVYY